MNLTMRLGKQFPESSPCLPRQLGRGQQGRYTSETVYLTSLSGSFCHLVLFKKLISKTQIIEKV